MGVQISSRTALREALDSAAFEGLLDGLWVVVSLQIGSCDLGFLDCFLDWMKVQDWLVFWSWIVDGSVQITTYLR